MSDNDYDDGENQGISPDELCDVSALTAHGGAGGTQQHQHLHHSQLGDSPYVRRNNNNNQGFTSHDDIPAVSASRQRQQKILGDAIFFDDDDNNALAAAATSTNSRPPPLTAAQRRNSNPQQQQNAAASSSSSRHVKVAVRIRPMNPKEAASKEHRQVVKIPPHLPGTVIVDSATPEQLANRRLSKTIVHRPAAFDSFHHVFGPHTQQEEVFEETTRDIVLDAFRGIHGSVMAYGATGSGKTHSMFFSDLSAPGIIPRAAALIFKRRNELESQEGKYVDVKLWFVEVYNEQVRDLLCANPNTALPVKLQDRFAGGVGPNGACCDVANVTYVHPTSAEHMLAVIDRGFEQRVSHETFANQHSSRSHAILSVDVEVRDHPEATSGLLGKMKFCDLAGSERAASTKNDGMRFREGANINKSLLALGAVVQALAKPNALQNFIPYRGSKLTRLLRECIGGNCSSLLLVCVSPSSMALEETLNTLHYATLARRIETQVRVNTVEVSPEVLKQQYELALSKKDHEIDALKEELRRLYSERVLLTGASGGDGEFADQQQQQDQDQQQVAPMPAQRGIAVGQQHPQQQHYPRDESSGGEAPHLSPSPGGISNSNSPSSPERMMQLAASRLRALNRKNSREIGTQCGFVVGANNNMVNSSLAGSAFLSSSAEDLLGSRGSNQGAGGNNNNCNDLTPDALLQLYNNSCNEQNNNFNNQRRVSSVSAVTTTGNTSPIPSSAATGLPPLHNNTNNNNNVRSNHLDNNGSNNDQQSSSQQQQHAAGSPIDSLLLGDLSKNTNLSPAFHRINDRLARLVELRDTIFNDSQTFGEGGDFALDADIRAASLEVVQYLASTHQSNSNNSDTTAMMPVAVPGLLERIAHKRQVREQYAQRREELAQMMREYTSELTALNKEIHSTRELGSEFERWELKHRIEVQRERMSYLEAEELAGVYVEQKRLEKQVNDEFRAAMPRCIDALERHLEYLTTAAMQAAGSGGGVPADESSTSTSANSPSRRLTVEQRTGQYEKLAKQRRETQAALAFLRTPVTPTDDVVSQVVQRLEEYQQYNAAVYSNFTSLLIATTTSAVGSGGAAAASNNASTNTSPTGKNSSSGDQQQRRTATTNASSSSSATVDARSNSNGRSGSVEAVRSAATIVNVPVIRKAIPSHLDVTQRRSMGSAAVAVAAAQAKAHELQQQQQHNNSNSGSWHNNTSNSNSGTANAGAGGRGASHAFWGTTTIRSRHALTQQISLRAVRVGGAGSGGSADASYSNSVSNAAEGLPDSSMTLQSGATTGTMTSLAQSSSQQQQHHGRPVNSTASPKVGARNSTSAKVALLTRQGTGLAAGTTSNHSPPKSAAGNAASSKATTTGSNNQQTTATVHKDPNARPSSSAQSSTAGTPIARSSSNIIGGSTYSTDSQPTSSVGGSAVGGSAVGITSPTSQQGEDSQQQQRGARNFYSKAPVIRNAPAAASTSVAAAAAAAAANGGGSPTNNNQSRPGVAAAVATPNHQQQQPAHQQQSRPSTAKSSAQSTPGKPGAASPAAVLTPFTFDRVPPSQQHKQQHQQDLGASTTTTNLSATSSSTVAPTSGRVGGSASAAATPSAATTTTSKRVGGAVAVTPPPGTIGVKRTSDLRAAAQAQQQTASVSPPPAGQAAAVPTTPFASRGQSSRSHLNKDSSHQNNNNSSNSVDTSVASSSNSATTPKQQRRPGGAPPPPPPTVSNLIAGVPEKFVKGIPPPPSVASVTAAAASNNNNNNNSTLNSSSVAAAVAAVEQQQQQHEELEDDEDTVVITSANDSIIVPVAGAANDNNGNSPQLSATRLQRDDANNAKDDNNNDLRLSSDGGDSPSPAVARGSGTADGVIVDDFGSDQQQQQQHARRSASDSATASQKFHASEATFRSKASGAVVVAADREEGKENNNI